MIWTPENLKQEKIILDTLEGIICFDSLELKVDHENDEIWFWEDRIGGINGFYCSCFLSIWSW